MFWFKYIFRIKFKIPILDLMLLLKNRVPFEGLYYSSDILTSPCLSSFSQITFIIPYGKKPRVKHTGQSIRAVIDLLISPVPEPLPDSPQSCGITVINKPTITQAVHNVRAKLMPERTNILLTKPY